MQTRFDRSTFFAAHYRQVDWSRQVLALAILRQGAQRLLSQYMATPLQAAQVEKSAYWSPSTYHKFYRHPLEGIASDCVDTVPCFFADIDWHDSTDSTKKPRWDDVYIELLFEGLSPTLLVQTPRGVHVYWYLERPIQMRWEKSSSGVWAPMRGAQKGLAWWRDISFALHRLLISLGLPADTSAAGTPARLLRTPQPWSVRHWDPEALWSLDKLDERTQKYKVTKRYTLSPGRKIALDEGVEEGERNKFCWQLAARLAAEYKGCTEAGWRLLSDWCARCTPPYPLREARSVWNWAIKQVNEGRAYIYRGPSERSRTAQGKYAARIYRSRTDEALASAVAALQEQGIADPWNTPGALKVMADMAGINYRTILRRKTAIEEKERLFQSIKCDNQT